MNRTLFLLACLSALLVPSSRLDAQTAAQQQGGATVAATVAVAGDHAPPQETAQVQPQPEEKKRSPWLFAPLVSSSPKMGTSAGALGAYLRYFDPESQVSMFGALYQYSTTDSQFGGVFARTSFGADHHRLEGFAGFGYIENEYKDYLGTGQTLQTTDDLRVVAARYLYRFKGNWFAGTQGIFANYEVSGPSEKDDLILDVLGVTGFNSGGVGLALMHDSRDNQDMPVKGWYANVFNLANSRWLGAEEDYDEYRLDIRWFLEHGKGHVLAMRQNNQFTVGAPTSAEATILLRGYKNRAVPSGSTCRRSRSRSVSVSREDGARRSSSASDGCTGGSSGPIDSDGTYPTYGGGVHFVLKPDDRMLVNLKYTYGNKDNQGLYLKFGYAW